MGLGCRNGLGTWVFDGVEACLDRRFEGLQYRIGLEIRDYRFDLQCTDGYDRDGNASSA